MQRSVHSRPVYHHRTARVFTPSVSTSSAGMQRPSLLSSPSPPIPLLPRHSWNALFIRTPIVRPRSIPLLLAAEPASASTKPAAEEEDQFSEFIEIGYAGAVHGLRGELRVKPTTDFPELRFTKPGRRWLRSRVSGKDVVSEVELTGGRPHHGQKSWIVSFEGIDTVDEAKQIVGSTLLIKEEDRPELEEGEFYTPDLVGMRVVLKETGKLVGTVVSVVNYGANDLLQVMLDSSEERDDDSSASELELSPSRPYVWVPFVEAIVPDVNMDMKEMWITPPKGLLELNLRSDMRSKKERRQLEWRQRKQLQRRLISAKRKLNEMGQKHVLEGFKIGERGQKSLLADQIIRINFKLFQHALESIDTPFDIYDLPQFISSCLAASRKNTLRLYERNLVHCTSEMENHMNRELHKDGLELLAKLKAAVIIIVDGVTYFGRHSKSNDVCSEGSESRVSLLQELLLDCKRFHQVAEQSISVPLVVVAPAHEIHLFEEHLLNNDYFGFNSQKVWFMEEEKLPIVSTSTDQNSNKILLRSPWEIIQSPTGPGGIFSLLSSQKVVDDLSEMGIEYVQICSLQCRSAVGHPLFFGFTSSCGVKVGIKIFEDCRGDSDFDLIFSMKHLSRICKEINQLQFHAIEEQTVHVEQVDEEWITVHPDKPNSCHLHLSIYSFLNTCSIDDVCIMQILE